MGTCGSKSAAAVTPGDVDDKAAEDASKSAGGSEESARKETDVNLRKKGDTGDETPVEAAEEGTKSTAETDGGEQRGEHFVAPSTIAPVSNASNTLTDGPASVQADSTLGETGGTLQTAPSFGERKAVAMFRQAIRSKRGEKSTFRFEDVANGVLAGDFDDMMERKDGLHGLKMRKSFVSLASSEEDVDGEGGVSKTKEDEEELEDLLAPDAEESTEAVRKAYEGASMLKVENLDDHFERAGLKGLRLKPQAGKKDASSEDNDSVESGFGWDDEQDEIKNLLKQGDFGALRSDDESSDDDLESLGDFGDDDAPKKKKRNRSGSSSSEDEELDDWLEEENGGGEKVEEVKDVSEKRKASMRAVSSEEDDDESIVDALEDDGAFGDDSSGGGIGEEAAPPKADAASAKKRESTSIPAEAARDPVLREAWSSMRSLMAAFHKATVPLEWQRSFLDALVYETVDSPAYIVRHGDMGARFYILTKCEGTACVVTKPLDDEMLSDPKKQRQLEGRLVPAGVGAPQSGVEMVLTHLYEGHTFGERSLLLEEPRNANIRITGKGTATFAYISKEKFSPIVEEVPAFRAWIDELRKEKEEMQKARDALLQAEEDFITPEVRREEAKVTRLRRKLARQKDGSIIVDSYVLDTMLGRGSFGSVFRGTHATHGKVYAVKVIDKKELRKKLLGKTDDEFLREVAVMKRLKHNYCVALYEVIDAPQGGIFFMVQEYMEIGDVMKGFGKEKPMPIPLARRYFRHVLSGLDYLHYQGVVHRDIKPENILLTSSLSDGVSGTSSPAHSSNPDEGEDGAYAKLADFGTAAILGKPPRRLLDAQGTPFFQPPEVLKMDAAESSSEEEDEDGDEMSSREVGYDGYAFDMWSLGVTLYNWVTGRLPFDAGSKKELIDKVLHQPPAMEGLPPAVDEDPALKNLILGLLDKNPARRLQMADVCNHDWVTKEGLEPLHRPLYKDEDLASHLAEDLRAMGGVGEKEEDGGGGGSSRGLDGVSRGEEDVAEELLKQQSHESDPFYWIRGGVRAPELDTTAISSSPRSPRASLARGNTAAGMFALHREAAAEQEVAIARKVREKQKLLLSTHRHLTDTDRDVLLDQGRFVIVADRAELLMWETTVDARGNYAGEGPVDAEGEAALNRYMSGVFSLNGAENAAASPSSTRHSSRPRDDPSIEEDEDEEVTPMPHGDDEGGEGGSSGDGGSGGDGSGSSGGGGREDRGSGDEVGGDGTDDGADAVREALRMTSGTDGPNRSSRLKFTSTSWVGVAEGEKRSEGLGDTGDGSGGKKWDGGKRGDGSRSIQSPTTGSTTTYTTAHPATDLNMTGMSGVSGARRPGLGPIAHRPSIPRSKDGSARLGGDRMFQTRTSVSRWTGTSGGTAPIVGPDGIVHHPVLSEEESAELAASRPLIRKHDFLMITAGLAASTSKGTKRQKHFVFLSRDVSLSGVSARIPRTTPAAAARTSSRTGISPAPRASRGSGSAQPAPSTEGVGDGGFEFDGKDGVEVDFASPGRSSRRSSRRTSRRSSSELSSVVADTDPHLSSRATTPTGDTAPAVLRTKTSGVIGGSGSGSGGGGDDSEAAKTDPDDSSPKMIATRSGNALGKVGTNVSFSSSSSSSSSSPTSGTATSVAAWDASPSRGGGGSEAAASSERPAPPIGSPGTVPPPKSQRFDSLMDDLSALDAALGLDGGGEEDTKREDDARSRMQPLSDEEEEEFEKLRKRTRGPTTRGPIPPLRSTPIGGDENKGVRALSRHRGGGEGGGDGGMDGMLVPAYSPYVPPGGGRGYRLKLNWGIGEEMGARHSMEDRIVAIDDAWERLGAPAGREAPIAMFAVFDGHGGADTSEFLRRRMPRLVFSHPAWGRDPRARSRAASIARDAAKLASQDDEDVPPPASDWIAGVLVDAAHAVDYEWRHFALAGGHRGAGSTGCVVFINGNGRDGKPWLYCSNVGDSRAYLVRSGEALPLSRDHSLSSKGGAPANPTERRRVAATGAAVVNGRLFSFLAVARAYGDIPCKDHAVAAAQRDRDAPEIARGSADADEHLEKELNLAGTSEEVRERLPSTGWGASWKAVLQGHGKRYWRAREAPESSLERCALPEDDAAAWISDPSGVVGYGFDAVDPKVWGKASPAEDALICTPEVRYAPIEPEDEFIIVACDGVWDVMTGLQAAQFVRRRLIKHGDPQRAAKELTRQAIALSTTDNVSACVIMLNQEPDSEESLGDLVELPELSDDEFESDDDTPHVAGGSGDSGSNSDSDSDSEELGDEDLAAL